MKFRLATLDDVEAIGRLIPLSVRGLNAGLYSEAQLAAGLEHVFGVDTQLIRDGTYYAVEHEGALVAAGGWSRRRTLYGGDQHKQSGDDPELDPRSEPARIRAFYVHPDFARRGLGRRLLDTCAAAARAAGFRALELGSTLPGLALYTAYGFVEMARREEGMPGGISLPVVRMRLELR